LAQLAGVTRAAITAIEDGRTRQPSPKLTATLASHLGIEASTLERDIETWLKKPLQPTLKPAAQNLLLIPPYILSQYYSTFADWRAEIAKTQTAFASMLRLNPAIIRDYESGKYQAMPDGLSGKLLEAFGISPEYLVALEGLPRS
jgi:DNA-binding XRE family transcriptional regulator